MNIRASSLPLLFDCPACWEAKYISGKKMPTSANATLGKAVHAGTALFDSAIVLGSPIPIDDAASAVVDAIHTPDEDIDWGEDSPRETESIALSLHTLYCEQISPLQQYLAVEATCESLTLTDLGLTLTGSVDRVRHTASGGVGIADIKTGSRAVNADGTVETKGHAAQIAVYELLAETSTGIPITAPAQIVGLQVAKTPKGQRAGIGEVSGGRELLLGDEIQPGLLVHAASIIKSGIFHPNPKSMMCHAKYCPVFGQCRWRK